MTTPADVVESKAEHIFSLVETFWPLEDGVQPSALEAVKGAREVANLLYGAMEEAGIPLSHGLCLLVCCKGEKPMPLPFFSGESQLVSDSEMVQGIVKKQWELIGILFGIVEAEKGALRLHTRGFDNSERTGRLLSAMHVKIATDFKRGKLMKVRQN